MVSISLNIKVVSGLVIIVSEDLGRLRWRCRRGMLELDLLLLPFLDDSYPRLTQGERVLFQRLLACSDQELYDWLVKGYPVDDLALQLLIKRIRVWDYCDPQAV